MKTQTILFTIILGLIFGCSPEVQAEAVVGKAAPDFSLKDAYGNEHALSDFQGKFVVLEWTNPDCPFVKKHYKSQNMQNLQKKYTDQGVTWLSVASSASGKQGYYSAEEWIKLTESRNASPTAVLLDPNGEVGKKYGAKTTPHMYVVNPEGKLIYQGAIDSVSSADPADIPESQNYVQMALDQSMAGEDVEIDSTKSYGCSVKY